MSEQQSHTTAIALGSNLGDREGFLRSAVDALQTYVEIIAKSKIYEAAALYVADQPDFLNAVILGTTKLEPLALLWLVKDIESEIGRTPTYRYGPRSIDIDILFHGDAVITTPELTLPHPRLAERGFMLRPLCDVAPQWRHPNGQTAAGMLATVPDGVMRCLDDVL